MTIEISYYESTMSRLIKIRFIEKQGHVQILLLACTPTLTLFLFFINL